jgi:hypothetical protein
MAPSARLIGVVGGSLARLGKSKSHDFKDVFVKLLNAAGPSAHYRMWITRWSACSKEAADALKGDGGEEEPISLTNARGCFKRG